MESIVMESRMVFVYGDEGVIIHRSFASTNGKYKSLRSEYKLNSAQRYERLTAALQVPDCKLFAIYKSAGGGVTVTAFSFESRIR